MPAAVIATVFLDARDETAPQRGGMMRAVLPQEQRACIREHARQTYPEECCGALLGTSGDEVRIAEVFPARNVSQAAHPRRYLVSPADQLAAEQRARAHGLEVVGYYHSHPDGQPVPSDHDLVKAWRGYLYLIQAVRGGVCHALRAWRLAPSGRAFEEVRVHEAEYQGACAQRRRR